MRNETSRLVRPLLAVAMGVLLAAPSLVTAQGPGTENGQWAYLGGDAWHTRYTPADEITADNFDETAQHIHGYVEPDE